MEGPLTPERESFSFHVQPVDDYDARNSTRLAAESIEAHPSRPTSGPSSMSPQTVRPDATETVFEDSLPAIHATLVVFYRFMEEEAEAFENTLRVWFERMARRNANARTPIGELRAQLLYVACKYARAFQIARFKTIEPSEENFTMALARTPEEVAADVLSKL
jgi:hypothetical protein